MTDSPGASAPARKLLILDLDETLIYATREPLPDRPANFRVGPYHAYKRPHLHAFLDGCRSLFDIAVWTASSPAYAAIVVSALFPDPASLIFVWAADRCTQAYDPESCEYQTLKNLIKVRRRLRQYPVGSIVAVDDTPRKWRCSYGNLVAVAPFEGDPADDELPRLHDYLRELAGVPDVRRVEKRNWRRLSMTATPSTPRSV